MSGRLTEEREADIRRLWTGSVAVRASGAGIAIADLLAEVDALRDPSFVDFIALTDTFLTNYPADIVDGSSGDPGPVFIAALRVARAPLASGENTP